MTAFWILAPIMVAAALGLPRKVERDVAAEETAPGSFRERDADPRRPSDEGEPRDVASDVAVEEEVGCLGEARPLLLGLEDPDAVDPDDDEPTKT